MKIKTKINTGNLKLKASAQQRNNLKNRKKTNTWSGKKYLPKKQRSNKQRINLQNIQTALTVPTKKKKKERKKKEKTTTNKTLRKRTKDLNQHFSKEDIQIAKKHLRRCSTSLIIRECKAKLQ